jgi:hypothetical protein
MHVRDARALGALAALAALPGVAAMPGTAEAHPGARHVDVDKSLHAALKQFPDDELMVLIGYRRRVDSERGPPDLGSVVAHLHEPPARDR